MNIKLELLKNHIADYINDRLDNFDIDASEIANSTAIKALAEIQNVIMDERFSDFEMVEEIVLIFEKYKLDFGACHDFY